MSLTPAKDVSQAKTEDLVSLSEVQLYPQPDIPIDYQSCSPLRFGDSALMMGSLKNLSKFTIKDMKQDQYKEKPKLDWLREESFSCFYLGCEFTCNDDEALNQHFATHYRRMRAFTVDRDKKTQEMTPVKDAEIKETWLAKDAEIRETMPDEEPFIRSMDRSRQVIRRLVSLRTDAETQTETQSAKEPFLRSRNRSRQENLRCLMSLCTEAKFEEPTSLKDAEVKEMPLAKDQVNQKLHLSFPAKHHFTAYSFNACAEIEDTVPEQGHSAEDPASLVDSRGFVSQVSVPIQIPTIDLDIKAMLELEKMQVELGSFSYYNHEGNKIVVHAEDEKAQDNAARIEKQVRDLARRCSNNPDVVDVIFSPRSFNMQLCGRIGATLHVNDDQQVIGMYLNRRGHAFWTSAAHNFIRFASGESMREQVEENGRLHTAPAICRIDGLNNSGNIGGRSSAETPTPYACCMIKPLGVSGQTLMHTVDFMIGQLPLMACHLLDGESCPSVSGMRDARDPCLDCGEIVCTQPGHRQSVMHYSIRKILCLIRENDEGYAVYKLPKKMPPSGVNPIEVYCHSLEKGIMRGRICSHQAFVRIRHLPYETLNAIFIEPAGSESPEKGDCGTVWVLKDTSEAIAMTVAKGDPAPLLSGSRPVWVAELLAPCLDAICKMHANVFPYLDELNPIFGEP